MNSDEPKRGDTVWVCRVPDRWQKRKLLVDLGPGIFNRYICEMISGKHAENWEEMMTTDPDAPKERTPHWVNVRNYEDCGWDRRILDDGCGTSNCRYPYRCVERDDADKYIAGEKYETSTWRFMEKIPERVPWTAEDYAERQICNLKRRHCRGCAGFDIIKEFTNNHVYMSYLPSNPLTYEQISKNYTLPDGTGLYKEVVE